MAIQYLHTHGMSTMINENKFWVKTLEALAVSTQLSRAQLTVGPLRHVKNAERTEILDKLVGDGLAVSWRGETRSGARPTIYRITQKGMGLVKNGLKAA